MLTHSDENYQEQVFPPQLQREVILRPSPWYHGPITRKEAEEQLNSLENGLFLIRESTLYPGDYTLCLCHANQVHHYRIIHKRPHNPSAPHSPATSIEPFSTSSTPSSDEKMIFYGYTIDEETYFESLFDLVDHYYWDADCLPCRLEKVLPKKGIPCFPPVLHLFHRGGWLLSSESFQIQEKIGSGDFAEVYCAAFKGHCVAAKCIPQSSESSYFGLNEAAVMTTLKHRNIVTFYGLLIMPNQQRDVFLLSEYMALGALVNYLRSRGRQAICQNTLLQFSIDACTALDYLSRKGLVHRDIAARNVLLDSQLCGKLCDFGLCQAENQLYSYGKVPIKWTAPEAIRHCKFTTASDVWSFGVTLWEIFSFGKLPYSGISVNEVVDEIEIGLRLSQPDSCPDVVYKIMELCWDENPMKRPTPDTILSALIKLRRHSTLMFFSHDI